MSGGRAGSVGVLIFLVPSCDLKNSLASLFVSESRDVPDTQGTMAALQRGKDSAAESGVKEKTN